MQSFEGSLVGGGLEGGVMMALKDLVSLFYYCCKDIQEECSSQSNKLDTNTGQSTSTVDNPLMCTFPFGS